MAGAGRAGVIVSVGTVRVQLPARACWWIKAVANRKGVTVDSLLREWILQKVNQYPGVDLSKSPDESFNQGE